MKHIVVVGGGFAGLWAAIAAARQRRELNKCDDVHITLINKTPYHDIRVRNYEADIESTRYKLAPILSLVGVKLICAMVNGVDAGSQLLQLTLEQGGSQTLCYDRLIVATGSQLDYPDIPGLNQYGFNIDTYDAAQRLSEKLKKLQGSAEAAVPTIVVVGSGFTGLELACELVARTSRQNGVKARIVLLDRSAIASTLGTGPNSVIVQALAELDIELMPGASVRSISANAIHLANGKSIQTSCVIWTTGMKASSLVSCITGDLDALGRASVDVFLKVAGNSTIFVAGDVACARVDDEHDSMMSCQHARPMGRIAGYNAVADLYGLPLKQYQQPDYVTCLDLGPWGALFMRGWSRLIEKQGLEAKQVKRGINHQRICPPQTDDAELLFNLAQPENQAPPK